MANPKHKINFDLYNLKYFTMMTLTGLQDTGLIK